MIANYWLNTIVFSQIIFIPINIKNILTRNESGEDLTQLHIGIQLVNIAQ